MTRPYVWRLPALIIVLIAGLSAEARQPGRQQALLDAFAWRSIGPANMAGRVTDIEAVERDASVVFVAAASGGVWKSTNAGTTWEPIFDRYGTASIGDIAVYQRDPDIVWVGTGESCVRNSVGWGDGVYKSIDGGTSFVNVGLRDTHHIGEVVTHPSNPELVYVAAQGHLWSHSGQRGVFRTRDGGKTWEPLAGGLPDDGRTGATDLKMDPSNPDVLYAAFWERIRRPYRFDSGGTGGGIFKTVDGGRTWKKLTVGLPEGPTGKIGLAISRSTPNVVMAIVEHGYQPPARTKEGEENPGYADLTKPGTGIYRSEDAGKTWRLVNRYNNRPFYYSHIYLDPKNDRLVYVLAGSARVSDDGGRSFPRSLQGISGDFHALWIDPANPLRFYVGNDKGAYSTFDRGQRFTMFDNMAIGQFYAVTLDNRDPYWVYGGLQDNGNWGGPSNSRDWNGILNDHWFKFHAGDGFHTTVDPNDWRTVYTEAQGGVIRRVDAVFRQMGKTITPTPPTIVNYADHAPKASAPAPGSPSGTDRPDRLPASFRFNWSAALTLSPHDSRVVYFGGNHLFRSADRGETWAIISPDLTTNDPEKTNPESGGLTRDVTSAETHCTIVTIGESPLRPGVIWVGTDDGQVQLTRDGGKSWTNVTKAVPEVPPATWVSRVAPSRFAEGTAYVSFDGHRSDDFRPWIFRTDDYGTTWTKLSSALPSHEPVYVVTEDVRNPRLLFVGTEFGVHVSLDGGASWQRLMNGLPTVPVHDLVVHPRDGDLVAATHGRSVWVLDDITPLQQLTDEVRGARVHLFANRTATRWRGISRGATRGHMLFTGRNPLSIVQRPPGNSPAELENLAAIHYYLDRDAAGPVTIEIREAQGPKRFTATVPGKSGINRYYWNLRFDPPAVSEEERRRRDERRLAVARDEEAGPSLEEAGPPAGPGPYTITLTVDATPYTTTLAVRDDPALAPPR